jgi:hypothetical protein
MAAIKRNFKGPVIPEATRKEFRRISKTTIRKMAIIV